MSVARVRRSWPSWLLGIAAGLALIAFFASASHVAQSQYTGVDAWPHTLSVSSSCVAFWALLAVPLLRLERRFPLVRAGLARALAVHAIASVALGTLEVVVCVIAFWLIWSAPGTPFPTLVTSVRDHWPSDIHTNLIFYALIVTLGRAYAHQRAARHNAMRSAELRAELAHAHLDALQSQLQPHFLFNALNTVAVLMHEDVDAAEETLVSLSEMLRTTLAASGRHELALRDELELLARYVTVEQARFKDRLRVTVAIDPDALDARVPTLLLQPLVENAIRHGIGAHRGVGVVAISAGRAGERLRVVVADDGPGATSGERRTTRVGIGLANTRARLQTLYGADHRFEVDDCRGAGFAVRIELPFHVDAQP